jgi:hypothetical protein
MRPLLFLDVTVYLGLMYYKISWVLRKRFALYSVAD